MLNNILQTMYGYSDANTRAFANGRDGEGVVLYYAWDSGFNAAQQATIRSAMAAWSAVANVVFVEIAAGQTADIVYARDALRPGVVGQSGGIGFNPATGKRWTQEWGMPNKIFFRNNYDISKDRTAALHEIGHALGLDHPQDNGMSKADRKGTIMSYDDDARLANKLLPYDILAIQKVYGTAQTKMGPNTYMFGKDKVVVDGGGIDTITAASSKYKVVIDLNDGAWSYANKKSSSLLKDGQVVIGQGTVIERAIGSKYNDTAKGNEADNHLKGGSGNDKLYGRAGDDRLYGGAGNDKLYGGLGADALSGGSGKDTLCFASLEEMGTIESHDRVTDFSKSQGDRFDFRKVDFNLEVAGRQKGLWLGNSAGDDKFGHRAGEFYYNKLGKEFRFDADGDGVADYALGTTHARIEKAYFLL